VSRSRKHFFFGIVAIAASFLALNCPAKEPRIPGVSWRVLFSVQPVYPKSFEISAGGPRSLTAEELKEAWRKKALLVAKGRRFRASPLVVHDTETVVSWPIRFRSVTGTITLTD
jgi:hypothetical protein